MHLQATALNDVRRIRHRPTASPVGMETNALSELAAHGVHGIQQRAHGAMWTPLQSGYAPQ